VVLLLAALLFAQTASTAGKRAKNKKTASVVDTGNESCSERSESEGDNDCIAYTPLLPGAACSSSANEFVIKVGHTLPAGYR
jgi:hypothetical protein